MKSNSENVPVRIYSGSPWHAALLKSILEDAGIPAFLKDEYIATIAPWNAAPGGYNTTDVMVAGQDFEAGRAIAETFEQNLRNDG
ncbi:hypothetical protein TBC1_111325 [Lentimicrobium saccharophilum]|uniref:DUF2007 domain-containing protein n=1 Tax=Lentimicrobium saccharophilum TaxID=1678841 RepID=A0A0S7C343_9BACT|nr:DUF2007 domain-containing protein [Lentimicrobium saccharophilum]GAP43183.1 hypothetical protein TBC1_111325 [Lentimicrobium saccharophilum]